ncbi:MAG: hypothetical protein MJ240_08220 [Kiritimatiellae bacterium]|nr:hypothetical protein [Kiritimatiellia bacterium]
MLVKSANALHFMQDAQPRTMNYLQFGSEGCSIDFGGHDQLVTSVVTNRYSEYTGNSRTNYGFRSASPAQIRFVGTAIDGFGYRGALEGAAGIEWDPQQADREFTYSNSVATTCGSLTVKSGSFRISQGVTFPNLGSLAVAAADGTIDVSTNGWEGGKWNFGDKVRLNYSYGPGSVQSGNAGASHGGHGTGLRGRTDSSPEKRRGLDGTPSQRISANTAYAKGICVLKTEGG